VLKQTGPVKIKMADIAIDQNKFYLGMDAQDGYLTLSAEKYMTDGKLD